MKYTNFKRKAKKLKRNPKLFFSDMKRNKKEGIKRISLSFKGRKVAKGFSNYTVVSAVYNVGRYLDDYFKSMVKQSLDFESNISLIMVDDGSTDNSSDIIRKWQKKYPNNIKYIWKENGGQASARNLGLKYVKTEWVTFIDPDDFLDRGYFNSIDIFLKQNEAEDIKIAASNLIFYHEDKKQFSDSHPLRFRFEEDALLPCLELDKFFHLSASSAIFLKKEIESLQLSFDSRIKPNFEDGHFIASYLSNQEGGRMGFIKNSKYYYRKRSDGSSTLDSSWEHEGRYGDVLEYGYLDVFEQYIERVGVIPVHVQRAVLYDLVWHIKVVVNNEMQVGFLNEFKRDNYLKLLDRLFEYIDQRTIMDFELAGCWFYHKVGILSCFKKEDVNHQIVYVSDYDHKKNQVQLLYYGAPKCLEEIYIDGEETIPVYSKTTTHDFVGRLFVQERRIWISLPENSTISIRINGSLARLSAFGKQFSSRIKKSDIVSRFNLTLPIYNKNEDYKGSWLLMDRNTQADDNAEHLYRYLKNNKPEQKIYFVLERSSHDWNRLENEGFNLLKFGSSLHRKALKNCSKLISSHADVYVTNYLGPKTILNKDFIFLQHGVIKDDLSGWLNKKEGINCFITSTLPEYKSICGDGSKYKFSKKEVVLTGLPRHDLLIEKSSQTEKMILVMPTWRKDIVGKTILNSIHRELNSDFMCTKFAQCWSELLKSEKLKKLAIEYGYRVVFFPHANLRPYLHEFRLPDYVEVLGHDAGSIQDLFIQSNIMITDYSSVAFEMAVQGKPVLYYQFDEDEIYSGSHTYSQGYFDYRRDGFGSVSVEHNGLLYELEKLLINNGKPSLDLTDRMRNTFPFNDGKNCERVYQAILALDQPLASDYLDIDILEDYADNAMFNSAWAVAEKRWKLLLEHGDEDRKNKAKLKLIEVACEQGCLTDAEQLYVELKQRNKVLKELHRVAAYLSTARKDWNEAVHNWRLQNPESVIDNLSYIRCLAELGLAVEIKQSLFQPWALLMSNNEKAVAFAWQKIASKQWLPASEILDEIIPDSSVQELKSLKPELMLSRCFREQGRLLEAHQSLVGYEKHTKNDIACREEIARLAYANGNWDKVISQLRSAYPVKADIPADLALIKIQSFKNNIKAIAVEKTVSHIGQSKLVKIDALLESGHLGRAQAILDSMVDNRQYRDWSREEKMLAAKLTMSRHEWQEALSHIEQCAPHDYISGIMRLKCLSALGRHKAIFRSLSSGAWHLDLSEQQRKLAHSLGHIAHQNWIPAIATLYDLIDSNDIKLQLYDKPHLLLADCLIKLGKLSEANDVLVKYEKLIHNDPKCRELIALLAFKRKNWKKVVTQLEKAYLDVRDVPLDLLIKMLLALSYLNRAEEVENIMRSLPDSISVKVGLAIKFKLSSKALPSTVDLVT